MPLDEARRVSAGGSARPSGETEGARTLLEDLADLVRRAVAAGDLALARALIDAQAKIAPTTPASVVDLAGERAKRAER